MHFQIQFDFKDWEAAFECFYRRKAQDNAYVFIVSTNSYTSGYWVEPASEQTVNDADTTVYRTVAAVKKLEKRIRMEREATGGGDGMSKNYEAEPDDRTPITTIAPDQSLGAELERLKRENQELRERTTAAEAKAIKEFERGISEGRAAQAILEIQGREKFLAELKIEESFRADAAIRERDAALAASEQARAEAEEISRLAFEAYITRNEVWDNPLAVHEKLLAIGRWLSSRADHAEFLARRKADLEAKASLAAEPSQKTADDKG